MKKGEEKKGQDSGHFPYPYNNNSLAHINYGSDLFYL